MDHLFENLCYKICGAAVEDFFIGRESQGQWNGP